MKLSTSFSACLLSILLSSVKALSQRTAPPEPILHAVSDLPWTGPSTIEIGVDGFDEVVGIIDTTNAYFVSIDVELEHQGSLEDSGNKKDAFKVEYMIDSHKWEPWISVEGDNYQSPQDITDIPCGSELMIRVYGSTSSSNEKYLLKNLRVTEMLPPASEKPSPSCWEKGTLCEGSECDNCCQDLVACSSSPLGSIGTQQKYCQCMASAPVAPVPEKFCMITGTLCEGSECNNCCSNSAGCSASFDEKTGTTQKVCSCF